VKQGVSQAAAQRDDHVELRACTKENFCRKNLARTAKTLRVGSCRNQLKSPARMCGVFRLYSITFPSYMRRLSARAVRESLLIAVYGGKKGQPSRTKAMNTRRGSHHSLMKYRKSHFRRRTCRRDMLLYKGCWRGTRFSHTPRPVGDAARSSATG